MVVTDYNNEVFSSIDTSAPIDAHVLRVEANLQGEIIEAGQMASMNLDLQGLLEGESVVDTLEQLGSPFGLKGDKAIGGVALFTLADNSTIAEVGPDVQIDTNFSHVSAYSDFYNLAIVQTGAESTDLGFSAAIAASNITSTTKASVHEGASIRSGELDVKATDTVDRINIVGGILKGKQVGIGTSIGVNNVTQNITAFVGRDDARDLPGVAPNGTLQIASDVSIAAKADGNIFSLVHGGGDTRTWQRQ